MNKSKAIQLLKDLKNSLEVFKTAHDMETYYRVRSHIRELERGIAWVEEHARKKTKRK